MLFIGREIVSFCVLSISHTISCEFMWLLKAVLGH